MHGLSSPGCGCSEASNFPQHPSEELRSYLEDIIRIADVAKSLLRACGGLREASASRTQPPTDSARCSPCRAYLFCFFCGQNGHIQVNCGSCKEYLAAGKCLLVKGRVVLPMGQEIPREVPRHTLKDHLDCWDLGNQSKDIQIPPSSQGQLPLEDVGSQRPQTQMVSLGSSQPRLPVHPHPPSAQLLCVPLSTEGLSRHSVLVQPQVPSRGHSGSSSSRSPSRAVPTTYSRGRPPSRSCARSRDLDDPCSYSYSSRPRSRDSRDSRDYRHGHSPPPAPRLAYSRLPEISRDEPTPVRPVDMFLASRISSIWSSRSSHASAHSRRSRSRSHTPQPSRRLY
ncbi:hypothetical protein EDD16DRAFT_542831 [Pisolithus croceorrhizus]|nr:hypothetical protein EDD16DRAFT_542831 [Pisolithus croceorrhizus]